MRRPALIAHMLLAGAYALGFWTIHQQHLADCRQTNEGRETLRVVAERLVADDGSVSPADRRILAIVDQGLPAKEC